jgi:hypothetical protein
MSGASKSGDDLHRKRQEGSLYHTVRGNGRKPHEYGEEVIDGEGKSAPQNENAARKKVYCGRQGHEGVHVDEDETAVSRLVRHEVDERLDGACFEIRFSVWIRMVAYGMADSPLKNIKNHVGRRGGGGGGGPEHVAEAA